MSLDVLKKIVDANPDTPDASLQRVRAADIVAVCDAIQVDKLDKKAKEIRFGSANFLREQPTDEKRETCIVIVPISYLRHLVKLAGG
jgi:hypothetical protein